MSESWPTKWKDLPIGGIIDKPGNNVEVKTGTWRVLKPVVHLDKCIKCLLCWIYCPDNAMLRLEDDYVKVDYDYCKGCGICAQECPTKAIDMIEEGGV